MVQLNTINFRDYAKKEKALLQALQMYNIEIASPMMFYTNRLATFTNWTFKNGNCTAEHMAHAGFYLIQDDCTKCVFCYKELDGWEVTDYPWDEHKSHKPDCPFVQLNKRDLTTCHIDEFIVLNSAVVKNKMMETLQQGKEELTRMFDDFKAKITEKINRVAF
ncbi:hypothetical protein M8J75_006645 [Diaphorina citri]|nr:hypothetical protein M8J75_006645 [Diaphorina citri]